MSTNIRRTPGGRAAVIYVTVGALIVVWSGIWGVSLLNHPTSGDSARYWCYGFLLTGVTLVVIGLAIGWIGRSRRDAQPPEADVSSATAADELPAAPRPPAMRSVNLAAAPGARQGEQSTRPAR